MRRCRQPAPVRLGGVLCAVGGPLLASQSQARSSRAAPPAPRGSGCSCLAGRLPGPRSARPAPPGTANPNPTKPPRLSFRAVQVSGSGQGREGKEQGEGPAHDEGVGANPAERKRGCGLEAGRACLIAMPRAARRPPSCPRCPSPAHRARGQDHPPWPGLAGGGRPALGGKLRGQAAPSSMRT